MEHSSTFEAEGSKIIVVRWVQMEPLAHSNLTSQDIHSILEGVKEV